MKREKKRMMKKTERSMRSSKITKRTDRVINLTNTLSQSQKQESVPLNILNVLAIISTNTWRAKKKIMDSSTGEIKEEMKKIDRHIEAIFDSLKQLGIEIIDLAGKTYDSGMALKVLSFEQTPGLLSEEIKETIKPLIICNGCIIQIGEVIVGTP